MTGFNTKVTPEIEKLTQICKDHTTIDLSLYGKYDVKRGLRDINGKGVLAGLTQVSNVQAVKVVDGKEVPCAGSLYYRGYNIKDLTAGFVRDNRFGFEETTYLLLFGVLPDKKQLARFQPSAGKPADASEKLRKRRHHEGSRQRYYERPVPKRADTVLPTTTTRKISRFQMFSGSV